jgi:hypothetical protein
MSRSIGDREKLLALIICDAPLLGDDFQHAPLTLVKLS